MTKLGTLLCTGMVFWAAPALAGFEFTPRAGAPASQADASVAAPSALDAPMPILPVEPVSAAPLGAPDTDKVLAAPVSRAAAPVEPVYVRRDRSAIPATSMKSKPMEAEALLTATANNQPVFPERLVINPYPLEESATHGGDMGSVNVEQAMLEETGLLRPVATPGSSRDGMRARTRPVSKAAPLAPVAQAEPALSGMTPLPGNVGDVERLPVASLPTPAPVSAVPAPAPLQPTLATAPVSAPTREAAAQMQGGQFSDAVGFGRDLPLALALSQVVPAEYSYAFAQNVNVGTTVSWQGGKPWNVVLDEMLAPNGMKADIQDGQVVIKNVNA